MGSDPVAYRYNLGAFHRKVTTSSSSAQTWFDRGLIWCYAFHHEEAARCFEKSIEADEECAMAYWGVRVSNYSSIAQELTCAARIRTRPQLQQTVGSIR